MKLYPHKTSTMAAGVVGMRIVLGYLLLLSIMIVGIKAQPAQPAMTVDTQSDSDKVTLKCGFPGSGDCTSSADSCTYKWYHPDASTHLSDGDSDALDAIRNGDYYCKLVTSTGVEGPISPKGEVITLTRTPGLGVSATDTCGKEMVDLTCSEKDATTGPVATHSRVVKKGDPSGAWQSGKVATLSVLSVKETYQCEAAGNAGGTKLKAISADFEVPCNDCSASTECSGATDNRVICETVSKTCIKAITKPTVADKDTTTGVELTCTPASGDNCATAPLCTYEWYVVDDSSDKKIADEEGAKYVVPRNGKYKCKTVKGSIKSDESLAKTVDKLPPTPTITAFDTKDCGETITIKCTVGSGTPATKYLTIQNMTDPTAAKNDKLVVKGATTTFIEKTDAKALTGSYVCIAATEAAGTGLQSLSETEQMTCTAPGQDTTSQASGGGDTTSNGSGGNKGDDSGASDLGRPASLLTIVCSLLTLTLSLRG